MKLFLLFEAQRKWTPELVELALTMKAYGHSIKEIIERIKVISGVDISYNAVKAKLLELRKAGKISSDPSSADYVQRRHVASGVQWTPELLDKLWNLKRQGMNNKEAALELGINQEAINDKIKKLKRRSEIPDDIKLGRRSSYFKWDDVTTWKLWDLIRDFQGYDEISKALGVTPRQIRDRLRVIAKNNGVPKDIDLDEWKQVTRLKKFPPKKKINKRGDFSSRKGASSKSPRRSTRGGSPFDVGPRRPS